MLRKLLPFVILQAACKKSSPGSGDATAAYSAIIYGGTTTLSEHPCYMGSAAACGSKMILAGGLQGQQPSAAVDINGQHAMVDAYDLSTGQWLPPAPLLLTGYMVHSFERKLN